MRAMRFSAGVHASGGFVVGGPIRPASQWPEPEEAIYLDSVLRFLRYYLRKNAAIRGVLLHFVLVALVIAICELRSTSTVAKETNQYILNEFMAAPTLAEVSDVNDVYRYVATVTKNCWSSRTRARPTAPAANASAGSQGAVAVNLVSVRQYKHIAPSSSASRAEPGERQLGSQAVRLGARFFPYNLTEKPRDTDIFRPFDASPMPRMDDPARSFLSNRDLQADNATAGLVYNGHPCRINGRIYGVDPEQYAMGPRLLLDFNSTESIDAFVADHQRGGFLRGGSKLLVIDTLFFEAELGYFFHAFAAVLFRDSAQIITRISSTPFVVLAVTNRNPSGGFDVVLATTIASIALDLCLVATLLVFLYQLARRTLFTRNGSTFVDSVAASFGFWETFDVILFVLGIVTVGCHFNLLAIAETFALDEMNSSGVVPQIYSMRFLTTYASRAALFETVRGWLLLTVMLRTFYVLQYLSRLAVVTETILSSVNDIIGVLLVSLLIMVGFAMGGLLLFGSSLPRFHTLFDAMAFFFQLMGSGELHDYTEFEDADSTAPLFFFIYFMIAYFVLLNVIIGILAASFVTTVESFDLVRRADWTLEALQRDIVRLWRRFRGPSKNHHDEEPPKTASQAPCATETDNRDDRHVGPIAESTSPEAATSPPSQVQPRSILRNRLSREQLESVGAETADPSDSTVNHDDDSSKRRNRSVSFASATSATSGATEGSVGVLSTDDDRDAAINADVLIDGPLNQENGGEAAIASSTEHQSGAYIALNDEKVTRLVDSESTAAETSAAYQRLLSALSTISDDKSTTQMVTLQQLRSVACRFMSREAVDAVFRKAQQQIGTPNGKMRHVRLSMRRIHRGEQLMAEVADQHTKVQQVHGTLLGGVSAVSADDAAAAAATLREAAKVLIVPVSTSAPQQPTPASNPADAKSHDGEDSLEGWDALQVGDGYPAVVDDDAANAPIDPLSTIVATLRVIETDVEALDKLLDVDQRVANRFPAEVQRTIAEIQEGVLSSRAKSAAATRSAALLASVLETRQQLQEQHVKK